MNPPRPTQFSFFLSYISLLGQRRYVRKQSGFGGQTKPVFHKKVPLFTNFSLFSRVYFFAFDSYLFLRL